jgi:hypothetical protein
VQDSRVWRILGLVGMRIARRKLQDELKINVRNNIVKANNLDMAKASRENVGSRFSEVESETAQNWVEGVYPSCYP